MAVIIAQSLAIHHRAMPYHVIYIVSAMLFIAIAPLPYGYYTLLRLVTTGLFIWAAIIISERKSKYLIWLFILFALLYNPIIKIHLEKETWGFINIISAIFLLSVKSKIKESSKN